MANTFKIRNLVEPDKKDVCWQDVMLAATEMISPLRDLEYSSKRADLIEAKSKFRKLKKTLKEFEGRLKGEVAESVERVLSQKKSKYKGNPDALMRYRSDL